MKRSLKAIAIADVVFGVLVGVAPWMLLPARVAIVDGGATGIGILHLAAGASLLARREVGVVLAKAAAWMLLALGAAGIVALAVSATFLWGVYGDVGRAGAMTMGVAIAVLLPYFVGFPVLSIFVLRGSRE